MKTENKVLVTVIMSVFKPSETFLRAAIESILDQTYKSFEFIIIVDGEDKNVLSTIESYKDSRIITHLNRINIGLTKSLNIGLEMARGKYIARMDADDISSPTRIEKQLKYMEKHKEIAAIGSYAKSIGKSGGLTSLKLSSNEEILKIRMLFYNAGIVHPTAFIRKEFLDDNGIKYDEDIKKSQDYALWIEILKYGKIKVIPEPLLGYRRHENQIIDSSSGEVEHYTNIIRLNQWSNLGVRFDEVETYLLKSITSKRVEWTAVNYNKFFEKLISWNKENVKFKKRYFSAEITRLWIHLALKRIIRENKFDMFFHINTLKIVNPNNFVYSLDYYLKDKILYVWKKSLITFTKSTQKLHD